MSDLGNKEVIAKNIQRYMDLHGKKRKDMCEAINVKYTTFSDWVNAKKYPRIDKIELMANYFGIEKSDLIEDKSKTTVKPENILLGHFNKLNQTGKNEAIKQVENLTYNPNYTNIAQFKTKQPDPDPYRVIAAHNDNNDPDQYDLMMEDAADLLDD